MKLRTIYKLILSGGILFFLVYILFKYLVYKGKITEESFWFSFKSYAGILAICFVSVIVIIYIIDKISSRNKQKFYETPKDLVDIDDALEIFRERFVIGTGIPYSKKYEDDSKYEVITPNKEDFVISNEQAFTDKETGNSFIRFEVFSLLGEKRGINLVILRTDLGKEYIKKNWRFFIKRNMYEQKFELDKKYPLTAIADDDKRIELLKTQLREEGYRENELRYLDAMKTKRIAPQNSELSPEEREMVMQKQEIDTALKLDKLRK